MSVLDTQDWLNPAPGGAKLLVNDTVNLLNVAGSYVSAWFDVTAFSGLLVEWQGFDLVGDFGDWQVVFKDSLGGEILQPTYHGTWRGDLRGTVNVPVLGAQAQVQVIGPAHNVNGQLSVTGHGGGPGAEVALASDVIAKVVNGALGAGVTQEATAATITEGAALLYLNTEVQPGRVFVQTSSGTGAVTVIAGLSLGTGTLDVRRIWIPPQPIFLNVQNVGGGVGSFAGTLTRERS